MALYRREKFWHYDFTVAGRRYRSSTGEESESRARRVESKKIAEAETRGPSLVLRKAPRLADIGPRFLQWVDAGRGLAANTGAITGWSGIV